MDHPDRLADKVKLLGLYSRLCSCSYGPSVFLEPRLIYPCLPQAATGQALPSNRLQDKYAAVKAQLKQKDTSSDEEEAEDSRAFTHSNPFALVYDSNNTSCDAASATSELDVTEEPQDVGGEEFPSDPTSAEVQAELAHLNAVVKLEQLMQWACANDDNIAGSAAQVCRGWASHGLH